MEVVREVDAHAHPRRLLGSPPPSPATAEDRTATDDVVGHYRGCRTGGLSSTLQNRQMELGVWR